MYGKEGFYIEIIEIKGTHIHAVESIALLQHLIECLNVVLDNTGKFSTYNETYQMTCKPCVTNCVKMIEEK